MSDKHPIFFNTKYLKKERVSYRQYQVDISKKCLNGNSLVVIPTGLGKTIIGLITAAERLKKYDWTKILVLAPTRPLVNQHFEMFLKFMEISEEKICLMTGKTQVPHRMALFKNSQVIVSTPQVIKNDLIKERYDLSQVSLLILDEAHKARKNYAYTFIAQEYIRTCKDPLILGLSASPGKNFDIIQNLCDNLFIENILYRTEEDPDVKDYIYPIEIFTEYVDLPLEFCELSLVWEGLFKNLLSFFLGNGLLKPKSYYSKIHFLNIARDLTISLKYENSNGDLTIFGEISDIRELLVYQNPRIIDVVRKNKIDVNLIYSMASSCVSLLHGKDLLETQDISLFESYLETLLTKAEMDVLSAQRITNSKHFDYVYSYIQGKKHEKLLSTHPKIDETLNILEKEINEQGTERIIVFAQFREMVSLIKEFIDEKFKSAIRAEKFIGQAMSKQELGYSQRQQYEILKEFRKGDINVLIATSVAEEGLDIANVDAVIFYEPVPSEIRLIQRRGRTGRKAPGRCFIILTKYTVDEPYNYIAQRKENSMFQTLICSENLDLTHDLCRDYICKPSNFKEFTNYREILREYREKKNQEYEILAKRSIEQIVEEIESLSNSRELKKFKDLGLTLFSDIYKKSRSRLVKDIEKVKTRLHRKKIKDKKEYLNRNVRALINIVKTYGNKNGELDFNTLVKYAEIENIIGQRFYRYFNNACYLNYLKKQGDKVFLIKLLN